MTNIIKVRAREEDKLERFRRLYNESKDAFYKDDNLLREDIVNFKDRLNKKGFDENKTKPISLVNLPSDEFDEIRILILKILDHFIGTIRHIRDFDSEAITEEKKMGKDVKRIKNYYAGKVKIPHIDMNEKKEFADYGVSLFKKLKKKVEKGLLSDVQDYRDYWKEDRSFIVLKGFRLLSRSGSPFAEEIIYDKLKEFFKVENTDQEKTLNFIMDFHNEMDKMNKGIYQMQKNQNSA